MSSWSSCAAGTYTPSRASVQLWCPALPAAPQASAKQKADLSPDALRDVWGDKELVVRLQGINGVSANGLQRLPGISLVMKVGVLML